MNSQRAAKTAGISRQTAWRRENDPNYPGGAQVWKAFLVEHPSIVAVPAVLRREAERALGDFAYFRLRYFGRRSTPWQVYAANLVLRAHEEAQASMDRRFIVINVPPGSGKSTLFVHDVLIWLLCRDRATRILVGSATETLAAGYTEQIMTTLERTEPPPLEPAQARRGAVQAEGCLAVDYGKFKPDTGRNWRARAFKIAQRGELATTTKEASVSAFGRDSSYLGQRPDVAVWDDLVTEETSGSTEARERTLRKWKSEAEQRVEPGGVLILQGQRLFPDDLYAYCRDLPSSDDDDNPDSTDRKYTHIVFKAHYDEYCKDDHGKNAQPYEPADPEHGGCLLDPIGLSWRFLRQIQRDDEQTGSYTYRIVFQQEDGDPSRALVKPLWVEGGEDPTTGERHIGCWDHNRITGIVPPLEGEAISLISVDSSPSKYWAIGWWLIHPQSQRRILIDLHRAKMRTPDALSFNPDTGKFTGLLEEWRKSAETQGRPITRLIFEANDSEVFFLDGLEMTRWRQQHGILVTRHKTNTNKWDPKYGVESLGPVYMHGQVRLPGDVRSGSRATISHLVREVTNWPQIKTSDCMMMQWFVEANMRHLAVEHKPVPPEPRPSWINTLPDGRHLRLAATR